MEKKLTKEEKVSIQASFTFKIRFLQESEKKWIQSLFEIFISRNEKEKIENLLEILDSLYSIRSIPGMTTEQTNALYQIQANTTFTMMRFVYAELSVIMQTKNDALQKLIREHTIYGPTTQDSIRVNEPS